MSSRLKILSGEERMLYPYLTTEWLSEVLEIKPSAVKKLAKLEGWKVVTREYVDHEGNIDTEKLWDGLTIPDDRRMQIATQHYLMEEEELSLFDEVLLEAEKLERLFPQDNFKAYLAALYRARQFALVKDAAVSLQLALYDAIVAISGAFGIAPAVLVDINTALDNGRECSFISQEDDTRFAMLLNYHAKFSGELLPEFRSPQEPLCH